jgi:hypothetical protein
VQAVISGGVSNTVGQARTPLKRGPRIYAEVLCLRPLAVVLRGNR